MLTSESVEVGSVASDSIWEGLVETGATVGEWAGEEESEVVTCGSTVGTSVFEVVLGVEAVLGSVDEDPSVEVFIVPVLVDDGVSVGSPFDVGSGEALVEVLIGEDVLSVPVKVEDEKEDGSLEVNGGKLVDVLLSDEDDEMLDNVEVVLPVGSAGLLSVEVVAVGVGSAGSLLEEETIFVVCERLVSEADPVFAVEGSTKVGSIVNEDEDLLLEPVEAVEIGSAVNELLDISIAEVDKLDDDELPMEVADGAIVHEFAVEEDEELIMELVSVVGSVSVEV